MAGSTQSIRAGNGDDLSQHVPLAGYRGYPRAQSLPAPVPREHTRGVLEHGAAQGRGAPVLRNVPRTNTLEDPSQHMPLLTPYTLPGQHVTAQEVRAQHVPAQNVALQGLPGVQLIPPMGPQPPDAPGPIPTRHAAFQKMEQQQTRPGSTALQNAGLPGTLAAQQGPGGPPAWQPAVARDGFFGSSRAAGPSGGMPSSLLYSSAAAPVQGPAVQSPGIDHQGSPSKKLAIPDSIRAQPSTSPLLANRPRSPPAPDQSGPSSHSAALSQEGPLKRAPTSASSSSPPKTASDPAEAALAQISLASEGAASGERWPSRTLSTSKREEDEVVCRKFTFEQLKAATDSFSPANLLTRGSHDAVYKGRLMGCTVAVKRLEGGGWQGPSEYRTEVEVLSRMRHPHIVLLMGHCPEEHCLVYEYLPGGNLLSALGQSSRARPLRWFERVRISAEIGDALLFLHQHEPPIVHRDLHPGNVLVDRNLSTKLADVGLARLLVEDDAFTAGPKGTPGYIDPAEMVTCEVSVLGDVYSYGLIGLQLLTGECNVALLNRFLADGRASGPRGLSRLADAVMGRLDASAGEWPADLARQLAVLFLRCSDPVRARRPDLAEETQPILQRALAMAEREAQRKLEGLEGQLMCPLSKQRMADPVLAADGFTYERRAIEAWLQSSSTSPLTGQPLEHKFLTPNNGLRQLLLSS